MNPAATAAFAAAAVFAVLNWTAVARHTKRLEYVAKPATLLALIVAASTLDVSDPARRWAFVVGLAFSLCGDVFLMLPGDRFIPGVASFFLAHVAYVVGFRMGDTSTIGLIVGVAAVLAFIATIGTRILGAVKRREPEMVTPVSAYIAVIALMVACAVATRDPLAIVGAGIFMLSDTLIAWNRFVHPLPWAGVAIMITYHVGQAALVLALWSGRPA